MINDLKNQSLFQSMFLSSIESILVVAKDGTIIMANPASEIMFGYESETLLGKNIEILIPENYRQQHKNYTKNPKARTFDKDFDLWGIKKDGTQFSLDISLSPTAYNDTNVTIAFLKDATKRKEDFYKIKQTIKDLEESNRKFDALANNLKGILFCCKNNRDYDMDYISEGCLKITGYSNEDFKNKTITYGQLILEKDRKFVWDNIQNAVKQKNQFDFEYQIMHKDGSIKYVWEKGEAVYNDKNEVMILEGFITDVSAQKKIALQLSDNYDKTKALMEANPDMMFIQDRNGIYIDWFANNPEKLFMPPEKFMGVNMKNILPPHVYKKIKKSQDKVIESGKMQLAKYSIQGKKVMKHFEARVVLMNEHYLLTIVRDITEEKNTDAKLDIRNNALAYASNSIVIADAQQPNMPIIYCNEAFEKMTGYNRSEILGRNTQFLQNDDRDQEEIGIMKNAIMNGEACHVIVRNYRKDGTKFWNDITITPIHDKNNELTHFIGVQNDATSKVKEEDLKDKTRKILELIAQDKPLKNIVEKIIETVETHLEHCIGSILLLDKENKTLHTFAAPNLPKTFCDYIEGTIIGPNIGSCGTAAFFKKEVIVSNIETSIFWENYKEIALENGLKACWAFPILSSTNQVLGTFSIYSSLSRIPSPNEKEILVNMSSIASVAIEKHNNTIALYESKTQLEKYAQELEQKVQERTQEVTAAVQKLVESNLNLEDQILITKQAESDAITSKNIASEIAKNFPRGFVIVVDKNLTTLFAEGEALDQLGLKQFILKGTILKDNTFFSDKRKVPLIKNFEKTIAGQHLSFEVNYKNRYFAVNTAPLLDENNKIIYGLHVYSDISQQKENELNIQNALEKEQELNELKSRFVSIASHEFRTPLSAILISAVLIGKQNETGKELKREKYVAQIERNVNHLVVILNDFLSLSKLEEGKVVALPERFNLIPFSKKVITEINLTLKKEQIITFTSNCEELFVYLDPKLLRHIVNNLLSNASKYSPKASCIDFKITQNQENVVLKITDQGIGIPIEEQKYLFDRFFRANNAANIEGTGLGLNIVKNYAKLMNGNVSFKSELNLGTTFCVEFPIHPNE